MYTVILTSCLLLNFFIIEKTDNKNERILKEEGQFTYNPAT